MCIRDRLPDYSRDVQEVDENKYGTTYVNYPKGYLVKFPGKVFFDFSLSNILTKGVIEKNDTAFTITREYSPYPDKVQYIADYTNPVSYTHLKIKIILKFFRLIFIRFLIQNTICDIINTAKGIFKLNA